MSNTKKQNQKKLIILIAPAILGILIAAFFYGLGGGSGEKKNEPEQKGFNTHLPDALQDTKNPLDKLSIYREAEKDSAKIREALTRDPYFNRILDSDGQRISSSQKGENALINKLSLLEEQLNKSSAATYPNTTVTPIGPQYSQQPTIYPKPKPVTDKDEELQQLDDIMTKALDIKYPERVEERELEKKKNLRQSAFTVNVKNKNVIEEDTANADSVNEYPIKTLARFYELSDDDMQAQPGSSAIQASVYESQSIMNGSDVKLRLDQDITIKGSNIPSGTFLYAKAQLQIGRLQLNIENIHYNNQLLPVSLDVYSYDGMMGISLTDAVTEEVAKQGADRGLQALQLNTLNAGIGAQAASAGIETVKNLIGRKTKIIKIKLKGGHPILLRNTNK